MREYFDTVARALRDGRQRRRATRMQRIRGRRSTYVPMSEGSPRIASF